MKIAAFIDGPNFFASSRNLGQDVDYSRLLAWLENRGDLVRAFYYTAESVDMDGNSPIRKLMDWLDYNGYAVVSKDAKEFTDDRGNRKIKGNMDIELAIDMLELAPFADHIYLFSGDGDFRRLVEAVQRRGVKVTVVSTKETNPSMIADELRRQADHFVDIAGKRVAGKMVDVPDIFREERRIAA